MTVQGKSLEKWALDKIASELAEFVGTVTGTQF
jgi:hypothetical protein